MKVRAYKNKAEKLALWDAKAAEMADKDDRITSGDYIKQWWRGIKDRNTKIDNKKKKSGSAAQRLTERENWIVTNCHFLKHYIQHRSQPMKQVRYYYYYQISLHCMFDTFQFAYL